MTYPSNLSCNFPKNLVKEREVYILMERGEWLHIWVENKRIMKQVASLVKEVPIISGHACPSHEFILQQKHSWMDRQRQSSLIMDAFLSEIEEV